MSVVTGGFPRRFGSYVLLKPLARGGMGELDLAVTGGHGMEKLCVIKRVLPHLMIADNVQRFREEATMVMRLSHGNLVGVLDAGREDGQFYLAMDFVEGKDLLATWNQCATRRVAFPVEIAAYIIKELARGLGYAHAYRDLGLVHRDISPANVLLSYSGEVKLTDFGLAISKLKEQQTAPGIIYGKLAYLAPEQARGQPLDGRADLYAAGILLWEMLTGQQLFPSPSAAAGALAGVPPGSPNGNATLDALERQRNPIIPPPSSVTGRVPAELSEIVLRALAIEPADRYQTGEDLRADLGSFLARHAPATDAATLASFMALLFQEQIEGERADRDALLGEASAMLSGRAGAPGLTDAGGHGAPPARGLVDPAHWASSLDARAALGAVEQGETTWATRSPRPEPSDAGPRHYGPTPLAATTVQRRGQAGDRRGRPPRPEATGEDDNAGYRVYGGYGGGLAASVSASAALDAGTAHAPGAERNGAAAGGRPVDEDARVGTTIAGRYFLRRLCGEGAMGRVYEGHHVEIGRRVAIKILHSNFRNTPDVVERFRREARSASRIGHPNIVDVTDSGTTPDGAFFFVMEYLDGVDLEKLISREGPLQIERALLIAAQVCRALVGAHTAGIIHRDLKPANVMLVRQRDEDDFVKVLDFGISKQSELDMDPHGRDVGLTRPDAAVGTPIYMAPEQVAGYPADGRTDVYAVGELLFEMLTATAPCGGADIIAVFNKKANEDPAPVRTLRPEVPEEVERMLARAMSRSPSDRHATMAELKDEIMACLARIESAPGAAASPHRIDPQRVRTGRVWRAPSRAIMITAAGVVVGLGVASTAVTWRSDLRAPWNVPAPAAEVASADTSRRVAEMPAPHESERALAPAPPPSISGRPNLALAQAQVPVPERNQERIRPRAPAQPPSGVRRPAPPRQASSRPVPRPATALHTQPATSGDPLARGRVAFAKGNFPEAVRLGRAAVATADPVGGHLLLGDTFYKMERFAEALAEYSATLKLAPNNERARRGHELASRRAQN